MNVLYDSADVFVRMYIISSMSDFLALFLGHCRYMFIFFYSGQVSCSRYIESGRDGVGKRGGFERTQAMPKPQMLMSDFYLLTRGHTMILSRDKNILGNSVTLRCLFCFYLRVLTYGLGVLS